MFRQFGAVQRAKQSDWSVARLAREFGRTTPSGQLAFDALTPAELIYYARSSFSTDPAFYEQLCESSTFGWPDAMASGMASQIQCPVRLAYGNRKLGGLISEQTLSATVAQCPQMTFSYFPDAGHSVHRSSAAPFIHDLKEFLGGLPT